MNQIITRAKAVAAVVVQLVTQALALGLLTGQARNIAEIVGAVATAILVHSVPNKATA